MKEKDYVAVSHFVRSFSWGEKFIVELNSWVTRLIYISFCIVMGILTWQKSEDLFRILLTTGISFILVTIFRKFCNSKRPYIIYNFEPIIKKEKSGESMPSRHVFSAFVIAMAFLYLNVWAGIIFLVLSVIMSITRVIGGVHFPKDVIVGALIGILSGYIGFYLI